MFTAAIDSYESDFARIENGQDDLLEMIAIRRVEMDEKLPRLVAAVANTYTPFEVASTCYLLFIPPSTAKSPRSRRVGLCGREAAIPPQETLLLPKSLRQTRSEAQDFRDRESASAESWKPPCAVGCPRSWVRERTVWLNGRCSRHTWDSSSNNYVRDASAAFRCLRWPWRDVHPPVTPVEPLQPMPKEHLVLVLLRSSRRHLSRTGLQAIVVSAYAALRTPTINPDLRDIDGKHDALGAVPHAAL
ncbi:hypothetical protein BD310DRAFT_127432 [Dichomitus squalens]|uniref:Uncharacterized protein n=1 Tax=Dichomitus squalens TaxID=114155 RepID=A0A4Q9PG11_9APHY|nr:hypothetical protein BD310DRAFT_127432 [Dichomitus squalens]